MVDSHKEGVRQTELAGEIWEERTVHVYEEYCLHIYGCSHSYDALTLSASVY